MPHRYTKVGPCLDCGEQIVKRIARPGDMLCTNCALTRATLAAYQMATKSGPAWDKWLATNGPRGRPPRPPNMKG